MGNELSELISLLLALCFGALLIVPHLRRASRNRAAMRGLARVGNEARAVIRRHHR